MNLISCIDLYLLEKIHPAKFFSVLCVNTSRLKLNFWKRSFRRRPQQVSLRPLQCDVEWFDCDRWKWQTMYISNFRGFILWNVFNSKSIILISITVLLFYLCINTTKYFQFLFHILHIGLHLRNPWRTWGFKKKQK